MSGPRVLLDCDGVLADFTSRALDVVADVTGRRYALEQVTAWDFCEALGLSRDEARVVKRVIGETRGFAASLAVYPGAVDGVRRLREIAEVHVVTAPWNSNPTWTYEREWWLRTHFDLESQRVHHSSTKHVFAGDVFVDDKLSHVRDWSDEHPDGVAVLWRTRHNQTESLPSCPVTSSWDDLVRWAELACG